MKGLYVLIVELPESAVIKTRRRTFTLDPGFYAYVGSAMNNLETRIARHLSGNKKRHWHIDFLLEKGSVKVVLSAVTDKKAECFIAGELSALQAVAGFGCSDCRCKSHLCYGKDLQKLISISIRAFQVAGLEPFVSSP